MTRRRNMIGVKKGYKMHMWFKLYFQVLSRIKKSIVEDPMGNKGFGEPLAGWPEEAE